MTTDNDEFKRLVWKWRKDPVEFLLDVFGVEPEVWQAEVLRAFVKEDRIAIRSGHGVGKTFLLAVIILWWLSVYRESQVRVTAPSTAQLNDALWARLRHCLELMPPALKSQYVLTSDKVALAHSASFARARTARKDNPDAFQGQHSPNMLFIADEASGVDDIIFEMGLGTMTEENAKIVLTGNPTRTSGYFYDAFNDPKQSKHWKKFHVPCAASTRVKPEYIAEVVDKYGEESNVYRIRVLGEFPKFEDDVIIPLHLVESAKGRDVETHGPVIWGVDVARFGDDRSVLIKRMGNTVLEAPVAWRGKDTMQVAGMVANAYGDTPKKHRPERIVVDVIGLGAGVVDRLRELEYPAVGVAVSESAAVKDRYLRLRDELWFLAREWFEKRECRLPQEGCEDLIAELCSLKYGVTSSGKIKAESKDEMKKRGLQSPDIADAFILTFAYGSTPRRRSTHDFAVSDYNELAPTDGRIDYAEVDYPYFG